MADRPTCVLVFSSRADWSAQRVAESLAERGTRHLWLDPSGFPMRAELAVTLSGGWNGRYTPEDSAEIRWEDITAVLYRRPRDFQFPDAMSPPERTFARAQARVAIGGVLASLPVRCVNHPAALADAEYKPHQLALAEQVGLSVPPTLLTTSPDEVRRFADEHGTLITKPLAMSVVAENGAQTITSTHRLDTGDLADLDGVELTAHLFQPELTKAYEVRLTAVGPHPFAVAIHADSPAAQLDWRTDYDALRYTVIDTPAVIVEATRRFLQRSGLTYGAFDFVVGPDGAWTFLECNAGGQWGWLAETCELPIADAFADVLTAD